MLLPGVALAICIGRSGPETRVAESNTRSSRRSMHSKAAPGRFSVWRRGREEPERRFDERGQKGKHSVMTGSPCVLEKRPYVCAVVPSRPEYQEMSAECDISLLAS